MSMDFGSLATVTLLAPPLDVFLHAVPHETSSYCSLCGADSCVCKAMNGVEDVFRPLPRDHRSRFASGRVAEHRHFAKRDAFEAETCDGRLVGFDFLRGGLSSCQALEVNS